jgi:ferritin-like metal-binding protein YciE/hemerythrin superfamily protein
MRTLIADRGMGEPISLGAALLAGKKVAPDASRLLADDHATVLGWFLWYEEQSSETLRAMIVRNICGALRAHMAGEEEWLYPASEQLSGMKGVVKRAVAEHQGAKKLVEQLERRPPQAKEAEIVRQLRDEIIAHVAEEESELFPSLRSSELDLYALGRAVAAERVEGLFDYLGKTTTADRHEEFPKMPIAHEEARKFFISGLKNAHAMTSNGRSMLEMQVQRLEQYPQMKAKLADCVKEKEEQLKRIEALLDNYGESRSAVKDAAMTMAATVGSVTSMAADDEIIKNGLATLGHAKMSAAAYETLILFGEAAGETAAGLRPLQQSLSEERGLACFIEENLRATGMRFLQLRSEGRQASH